MEGLKTSSSASARSKTFPPPIIRVDAIISNCVINLSTDKGRVFREAFRVLKPGGRLMISDMVTLKELPKEIMESVSAYAACIAGALKKDDYLASISAAGFSDVSVVGETFVTADLFSGDSELKPVIESVKKKYAHLDDGSPFVSSIKVSAIKPDGAA